jgi:CheY-like chemotaxis protein
VADLTVSGKDARYTGPGRLMEEVCAVAPRVLVIQRAFDVEGVEQVVAPDGEAAVALLQREWFDAVFVDLEQEPLDGWCVLSAVGCWPHRPRVIVTVADRADIPRAKSLGADHCMLAGTNLNVRALEAACRPHPETSSPRPTPNGVSA